MPRCIAKTAENQPCQRIVGASSPYCFAHDPSRQQERIKNAATAGRGSREIREIKKNLRTLYVALERGELDPRTGATMVQVANALLRALTTEAELAESRELERRLARIEKLERESRWSA